METTRERELRNHFEDAAWAFLRKKGYDDDPWYITLVSVEEDIVTIKEIIFKNEYQLPLWYFTQMGLTRKGLEKIKEIFF